MTSICGKQVLRERNVPRQPVSDLSPQLALIRGRFLDRLAQRCIEIETLVQQIETDGVQVDLVQEIAGRAHKIAGVAPTLGFARLGSLSVDIEARLSKLLSQSAWPDARERIEAYLTEIEAVLETYDPI
ncbi:Hpt domain-containing protein [uncultured Marivita sp.]|uniref:Hpt domain-containing protein n=1 Tax=uncultured Marivita sp. TaxID=888080 RepID=UPI00262E2BC3|nr:Hpt domain-containing protein [uncultured Marivita sp.]